MCAAGNGRASPTPGQQLAFGAFLELCIVTVSLHLTDPHNAALTEKIGKMNLACFDRSKLAGSYVSKEQPSTIDDPTIKNGFYDAPSVCIVFTQKNFLYSIPDAFCCAENMVLMATELGIWPARPHIAAFANRFLRPPLPLHNFTAAHFAGLFPRIFAKPVCETEQQKWIDTIFEEQPYLSNVYPGDTRKLAGIVFEITDAEIE